VVRLESSGQSGDMKGMAMNKDSKRLPRGTRRVTLAFALCSMMAAFSAVSAMAATHHPTGEYAPFADCPLSNASVEECILANTTGGEFVIGSTRVPIEKTITLQGGTIENATTGALTFVGAEDGNTLSKTPQKVPGGLTDLVKCNEISNSIERAACELVFENGATGVNATTELAAPASSIGINTQNLVFGEGIALKLPVKVHLENAFLGSSCYIGSNSNPVIIELTTGTTSPPPPNKPISGNPGEAEFKEEGNILAIKNNVLVNNSFAAPKASGCGGVFSLLIDPIVDSKVGLPSAAGNNTAILKGTLEQAYAPAVRASE
jgi:hypothetical protein